MARTFLPRLCLGMVAACLLAASSASGAAPSSTARNFGTCVTCTSTTHCASINGNGSTGCTFTTLGCQDDLAICVCGNCLLAPDTPENQLDRITPAGRISLHAIGGNRFAAWSCSGELIALAMRQRDGSVVDLPVEPYRERYRYQTLRAQAG